MVKWDRVCRSKKKGGLGVKNLHRQNVSLLTKWWWKLEKYKGLWQDVILVRYFKNDSVSSVKTRINDSPCWKAIMKVKEIYMRGRKIKVKSGNLACMWYEEVDDGEPFCQKYPELFSICHYPNCTVVQGLGYG